jgi:hypothetical protein
MIVGLLVTKFRINEGHRSRKHAREFCSCSKEAADCREFENVSQVEDSIVYIRHASSTVSRQSITLFLARSSCHLLIGDCMPPALIVFVCHFTSGSMFLCVYVVQIRNNAKFITSLRILDRTSTELGGAIKPLLLKLRIDHIHLALVT